MGFPVPLGIPFPCTSLASMSSISNYLCPSPVLPQQRCCSPNQQHIIGDKTGTRDTYVLSTDRWPWFYNILYPKSVVPRLSSLHTNFGTIVFETIILQNSDRQTADAAIYIRAPLRGHGCFGCLQCSLMENYVWCINETLATCACAFNQKSEPHSRPSDQTNPGSFFNINIRVILYRVWRAPSPKRPILCWVGR